MITAKTVLVLGAGASVPFGFPSGQFLKDLICDTTLTNPEQVKLLNELGFDSDEIQQFRLALIHSGRPSVDAFLEYREDFIKVGKAAIALTLLPYEKTKRLFLGWIRKRLASEKRKEGNWYDYLFSVMGDGVPFNDFDKNKLSIVTFNYDRSIEHYLFTVLKNSHDKTDEEVTEVLRKFPILHVYGSLGPLGWQERPAGLPSIPYDSNILKNTDFVKIAADNINIVRASEGDSPEFTQARRLIGDAEQLFFLGFGYHPNNLKRLKIGPFAPKKRIQGTSLGLSNARKIYVLSILKPESIYDDVLFNTDVYTFLHDKVLLGSL